jgi:hypothetical protein
MPDLVITTATLLTQNSNPQSVILAEAVTLFQPVYQDSDAQNYGLSQASDTEKDTVVGFTLGTGVLGGPAMLARSGDRVDLGAILTKGVQYCLSTNNGKIAPQSDLIAGDAVVPLFLAETTSIAVINIFNPSVDIIL